MLQVLGDIRVPGQSLHSIQPFNASTVFVACNTQHSYLVDYIQTSLHMRSLQPAAGL